MLTSNKVKTTNYAPEINQLTLTVRHDSDTVPQQISLVHVMSGEENSSVLLVFQDHLPYTPSRPGVYLGNCLCFRTISHILLLDQGSTWGIRNKRNSLLILVTNFEKDAANG